MKARGGWNYARDPSTRLLTVAWCVDGRFHVWLPGVSEPLRPEYAATHLGDATLHTGPSVPAALIAETGRAWVAHNADGFDSLVWEALTPPEAQPVEWIDTVPRAMAIGMPGMLDKIGQLLWGIGKYADGKAAMKKACIAPKGLTDACNVPVGQVLLIAKYNLQDVRLMRDLWDQRIVREYRPTEHEAKVLRCSTIINARGCRVDRGLTEALIALSSQSKHHAETSIADLTKDDPVRLKSAADLQSRATMFKWLDSVGVSLGSSLRKDIVAKFIETHGQGAGSEGPETSDNDEEDDSPPLHLARVIKVLELRMQALRITEGKLQAALWSLSASPENVIRHLLAYWGAHTGRYAGRRLQIQNLPRPKPGIDTWALVSLYERTKRLDYDSVAALLPIGDPTYRFLSVDDAASALLRSILLPPEGLVLGTADLMQIEARVLAWLAGEEGLLNAFWRGEDPYIQFAERMLGPKETWKPYYDKDGRLLPAKKHPNRQGLGKVPWLGAGYQMGGTKLNATAAIQLGIDLADYGVSPDQVVWAFRRMYPKIAGEEAGEYKGRPYFRGGLWDQLESAALRAVERGERVCVQGKVWYYMNAGSLVCELPSGRRIVYRNATVGTVEKFSKPKKAVKFTHPRYGWKTTYGGFDTENVVQGIARDCLAAAIVRWEERGMPVCFTVHDEGAAGLRPEQFEGFMGAMTECPDWLTDFPLDAEGSYAPRYAKSPPPGMKDRVWRNGKEHK